MLTKTNAALKQYADAIIRLEGNRAEISESIKEIYDTAKAEGFTPGALKKAIKIHAMDKDKREKFDQEQTDLLIYLEQLEGKAAE